MTHYARKQTKDLAKQKQTASFWEVVGLDEDDVVSKGYIEAYNCLRESHHTVKMVGVPKDGDRVLFKKKSSIPPKTFNRSIPGWDDHDDDDQKFDADVKISAWAIFSPEEESDRDVKTSILSGGVGVNHMMIKIVSKNSGWGNENDPICVMVYGQ
eukprot:TRINITY_DN25155_c0_g1_i2.p1 TRINITY_DN25155_c0_g1~~TRINITY_DN25155_c0_g1_i2.p1  ORF type:complete len:155 (+),score=25.74 TRINITY_DN25155_c0_g1_i2:28-492(+)